MNEKRTEETLPDNTKMTPQNRGEWTELEKLSTRSGKQTMKQKKMKLSTLNPKIGHRQKKKTRHGLESTQSGTQHKKRTWMREKRKQRTKRPCLNV